LRGKWNAIPMIRRLRYMKKISKLPNIVKGIYSENINAVYQSIFFPMK
jgi:hypothetical protein